MTSNTMRGLDASPLCDFLLVSFLHIRGDCELGAPFPLVWEMSSQSSLTRLDRTHRDAELSGDNRE